MAPERRRVPSGTPLLVRLSRLLSRELLAAELRGTPGWVALSLPLAFLPGFNLSVTPLPAPRKVQPLDRSVLAAGSGEEGGERQEERGEGRGEGGRRV